MKAIKRFEFVGVPIDNYSFDEAVKVLLKAAMEERDTLVVHFINVAKIVRARRDKRLLKALWEGDLVLADGKPLLPLGRLLGIRLPTRVNGTDLMEKLMESGSALGISFFLLGAKEDILRKCIQKIKVKYLGIKIAGFRNGYFSPADVPRIINQINEVQPDILFIGLPTPQKELFALENSSKLKAKIIQGVGGSFEVLAGATKRAPIWMQRFGLEWLFRVIQEPKRMFWRYFSTNLTFLWIYTRELQKKLELQKR